MGACVNARTIDQFESGIIDLEWSIKTGNTLAKDKNESSETCKNIRPCVNFAESQNWHRGLNIYGFISGSINRGHLLSEGSLGGRTMYKSKSPSYNNLIDTMQSDDGSYLSSSSSETDGRRRFYSYDGTNKRVVNRYEIGLQMLKAQIHCGANPKVLTTHGDRSCLMFAVLAEDFCFIKKLVKLGVDVNQKNRVGETALSLANELHRDDIARYLRRNGAIEQDIKYHGNMCRYLEIEHNRV